MISAVGNASQTLAIGLLITTSSALVILPSSSASTPATQRSPDASLPKVAIEENLARTSSTTELSGTKDSRSSFSSMLRTTGRLVSTHTSLNSKA